MLDISAGVFSDNLPMQNEKRPSRGRPPHARKRSGKRTQSSDRLQDNNAAPRRRHDDDDGPQPVSNDTALGYSSPRRRKSTPPDYTQKFSKVYGVDKPESPRRDSRGRRPQKRSRNDRPSRDGRLHDERRPRPEQRPSNHSHNVPASVSPDEAEPRRNRPSRRSRPQRGSRPQREGLPPYGERTSRSQGSGHGGRAGRSSRNSKPQRAGSAARRGGKPAFGGAKRKGRASDAMPIYGGALAKQRALKEGKRLKVYAGDRMIFKENLDEKKPEERKMRSRRKKVYVDE